MPYDVRRTIYSSMYGIHCTSYNLLALWFTHIRLYTVRRVVYVISDLVFKQCIFNEISYLGIIYIYAMWSLDKRDDGVYSVHCTSMSYAVHCTACNIHIVHGGAYAVQCTEYSRHDSRTVSLAYITLSRDHLDNIMPRFVISLKMHCLNTRSETRTPRFGTSRHIRVMLPGNHSIIQLFIGIQLEW